MMHPIFVTVILLRLMFKRTCEKLENKSSVFNLEIDFSIVVAYREQLCYFYFLLFYVHLLLRR